MASSSLIPFNDPTLLFSNAGMNQFKDVFLGNETRPYLRATTSQKCMRVSGKHNDFKDVGHSPRHHTFFEMLGNFSFGDYFKADAIRFAWDLVTKEYGLDASRTWITVYKDDDEAWNLWRNSIGVPAEKIYRLGEKDNFWAMGDTGPCGPCSELHYDFGTSPLPNHGNCDLTCACGRWVEIWNLVFMQYNRDGSGKMEPLPSPSIDTGMGFERITTILQDKKSNYDTDLFQPLLGEISRIANRDYGSDAGDDVSMRIVADHARAITFVIADGQYPGNDKRGYVLRKIMRRAVVHGKKLGIDEPFIYRVTGAVVELMKGAYPELIQARDTVARVVKQEEEAFAETLGLGLRDLNERVKRLKAAGMTAIPGEDAFYLYDTRGLPLEILEDLAQENGMVVDEEGFNRALEQQRERSRLDYEAGKAREEVTLPILDGRTTFVGYDYQVPVRTRILALLCEGRPVESLSAGQEGDLILEPTPFYAEAGGQVGDIGTVVAPNGRAEIRDTRYRGTVITHQLVVLEGQLRSGEMAEAVVDIDRRRLTMKNHTGTHLLHAALRKVLGPHVKQAGSLVAPDRLRFDFTHFAVLSPAEIRQIEDDVNSQIWRNEKVITHLMELEEALKSGAVALFGEKYREQVRVVEVPGYSKELCGGTHVAATGAIGALKIIAESGIAAGVRRIEAVTGPAALERFRADEELIEYLVAEYKISRDEIPAWLEKQQSQTRELQKQVSELKLQQARAKSGDISSHVRTIKGVKVLARVLPQTDRENLRTLADDLKQKLESGVIILGSSQDGKAMLVVMTTSDLVARLPAGKLIKQIAPLIGGSGGGKAELAEAGGKDFSKLADAIEKSYGIVEKMLGE